jgi:dihydrofolate reductase
MIPGALSGPSRVSTGMRDGREFAMRPVVLQICELSIDGIIVGEGTELFDYCRAIPDDPAHEAWITGSLERAGVHIMGRATYEGMAQYFPTATGGMADAMNRVPKAVFSSTLQAVGWAGTTIVSGDLAAGLDALRQHGSGEILAHGGIRFAQSLARLDLVDEYRLGIVPGPAGAGPALFADLPGPRPLELRSSTAFANGIVALTYRRPR